MFRLRASNFLSAQKVTKEPSKVGGISISLPPLKSPSLKRPSTGGTAVPPIGCTPRGTVTWKVQRRNGSVLYETAGGCGPGAGACSRQSCPSSTSHGGGAITEPPRDGWKLGATVLVGVSTYSSNTERQRAARGAVSCSLPALDGDNYAPWCLPRK